MQVCTHRSGRMTAMFILLGLLLATGWAHADESALWSSPRLGALGLWRSLEAAVPAPMFAAEIEIPVLRSEQGGPADETGDRRRTLMPALMSALLPGAGQLRNGTLLRGIGFLTAEVAGWVAFAAFTQGAENKYEDIERFADQYWSYATYAERGNDPSQCAYADLWSADTDSLIQHLSTRKDERYYEYLTRDDYACGWNSVAQDRPLYGELWDDREDLRDARKFTAEMIGLNHLAAAIDAFLVARKLRLGMGGAELTFRAAELGSGFGPQVVIEKRFD